MRQRGIRHPVILGFALSLLSSVGVAQILIEDQASGPVGQILIGE